MTFPNALHGKMKKSQENLKGSENWAFIKKKEKVFFEKIVLKIDKMLLD